MLHLYTEVEPTTEEQRLKVGEDGLPPGESGHSDQMKGKWNPVALWLVTTTTSQSVMRCSEIMCLEHRLFSVNISITGTYIGNSIISFWECI